MPNRTPANRPVFNPGPGDCRNCAQPVELYEGPPCSHCNGGMCGQLCAELHARGKRREGARIVCPPTVEVAP